MVSVFTPNIQLEEPARGDDVGTWDTPVNNNMTLIDLVCGAFTTISLNNSNVVLSAAQFQSKFITFNSTLTGSVTITFPTSFNKSYEIYNLCTGSSAFTITLKTTVVGAQVICAPPGEIVDVVNANGGNMFYRNLGRVGSYMDFCGSSVPNWVSGCSIPPYLNCDGTSFSSATYPALAVFLGGTTLPDRRGTVGGTLNQGTGRYQNGVNGNVNYSVGGADTITLTLSAIPTGITSINNNQPITVSAGGQHIPVANTAISNFSNNSVGGSNYPVSIGGSWSDVTSLTQANNISVTSNNTGGASHLNVQPTTIYGLSLIRAG